MGGGGAGQAVRQQVPHHCSPERTHALPGAKSTRQQTNPAASACGASRVTPPGMCSHQGSGVTRSQTRPRMSETPQGGPPCPCTPASGARQMILHGGRPCLRARLHAIRAMATRTCAPYSPWQARAQPALPPTLWYMPPKSSVPVTPKMKMKKDSIPTTLSSRGTASRKHTTMERSDGKLGAEDGRERRPEPLPSMLAPSTPRMLDTQRQRVAGSAVPAARPTV